MYPNYKRSGRIKKIEISDDEILDIAYMIFFYNTYKAPGRQDA
jgi:hypothetical protein